MKLREWKIRTFGRWPFYGREYVHAGEIAHF